jgi:hypothetical protein
MAKLGKPRPGNPRLKDKTYPVTTVVPHPDAWNLAKELADGDVTRLEIINEGLIIVHNNPRKSP